MNGFPCAFCVHFAEDLESGESTCDVNLDEDEMEAFLARHPAQCPFYQPGDEYKLVQKQN